MAGLGRSLSLNTGGSLFGAGNSNQQQQQGGGLFGSTSTSTSQPAQSGGLFGGAQQKPGPFSFGTSQPQQQTGQATPQAQTGGGLFGGAATTSAGQTGGLFGATTASTGGGLFGNTNTSKPGGLFGSAATSSAPPAAGGLFGNAAATSQPQASQPAQTGGLFGNPVAGSQPQTQQPAQTGGLFGGLTSTPQAQTGGLFGNTTTSKPGGLFGASTTTTSAPSGLGGGLFGSTTTSKPGGLFGASTTTTQQQPQQQQQQSSGGLFGALNASAAQFPSQQQQTVPAVRVDPSNIKPTTRFSELHEEVQQLILHIDSLVQSSIEASMKCSQVVPKLREQIEQLPNEVELCETQIETVEGALSRDAVAVGQNKEIVRSDAEDAMRVFRAVENLKLPAQFHYSSIGGGFSSSTADGDDPAATDLLGYFSTNATELHKTLDKYQGSLGEVEQHLRTVEGSAVEGIEKLIRRRSMATGEVVDPTKEGLRELAGAMRGFEDAILRVAGHVGETREGVVELSVGGLKGGFGRR